jgi:hypothetical protein
MGLDEKQLAPPYVSFKTFESLIDALSHGVPTHIDRSVMPSFAGGVQAQLLLALRFLGLTDENGETKATLQALAEQKDDRQRIMGELLRERYAPIFSALDLMRTTPMQLEDAFRKFGISGETLDKSVRFFLSAVESAGISVSPLLKARKRNVAPKSRRGNGARNNGTLEFADTSEDDGPSEPPAPLAPIGESISVPLKSGGTCTFSASTSFIKMSKEDRSFVFDIIDRLRAYEESTAADAKV